MSHSALSSRIRSAIRTRRYRNPREQSQTEVRSPERRNSFRRRALCLEHLEDRRLLTIFTVMNSFDSGAGSLRQAIIDSNSILGGDIVRFDSGVTGTITLTSGEIAITDSVDIQGPGSSVVTVSGNNLSRVFYVSADATIGGLTISGGNSSVGGGINNAGTLTLENSTVSDNSAGFGAGIFNNPGSTGTLRNVTFTGNVASNAGARSGTAVR